MNSAGMNLLCRVLQNQDLAEYVGLNLRDELFTEPELDFYNFIETHIIGYGKLPSIDVSTEALKSEFIPTLEPIAFYKDRLDGRFIKQVLKEGMGEIETLFNGMNHPTSETIIGQISTIVGRINAQTNASKIYNFVEGAEMVLDAYQSHGTPGSNLKMGWSYLDNMTQGLIPGDLVSLIGRPGLGKTFIMLYMANFLWETQGIQPMFVTMEMNPLAIFQRLTAVYTKKTINNLKTATFSTKALTQLVAKCDAIKGMEAPFFLVYGGSKTTVEDLVIIAHQLKPKVIFIDGAYLLRHKDPRLNTYARVEENCDLIKYKLATDLNVPVICSWQFNREMIKKHKKKKGESIGLEDIAHSDSIGQLSSLVLGLLEDDGVEQATRRRIDILKGRNGERGDFHINWDFIRMDFSEAMAQEGEVLKYF